MEYVQPDWDALLRHSSAYGIRYLNFKCDVELVTKVVKKTVVLSIEQFLAVYNACEYAQNGTVRYKYLPEMVNIPQNEARLLSLRLQQMMIVPKYSETANETILLSNQRAPVVCIPERVDKSDPETYSKYADQYHTSFPKRVQDLTMILRPYIIEFGIRSIIALNDGAGACQEAVKRIGKNLKIECVSQDPSLPLVEIAKREGRTVICGRPQGMLVRTGVFVISHSESVDPGLVNSLLLLKKSIIVFESSEEFLGKDRLYDNGKGVYSTYNLPTYAPIADVPRPSYSSTLDILTTLGEVYISDPKVIYSLSHVAGLQSRLKVNTLNPIVYEKAQKLELDVAIGENGIGLYINKIDKECDKYFSLKWESFHTHFSPVSIHRSEKVSYTVIYMWKRDKSYTISIGGYNYGWVRGSCTYSPTPNSSYVISEGMNLDFRDMGTIVVSNTRPIKLLNIYDYRSMSWSEGCSTKTPWRCPSPELQLHYDFVTDKEGYRDGVLTERSVHDHALAETDKKRVKYKPIRGPFIADSKGVYVKREGGLFAIYSGSYVSSIALVLQSYKYRTLTKTDVPKWLDLEYKRILSKYFPVQQYDKEYVVGVGDKGSVEIRKSSWTYVRKEVSHGKSAVELQKVMDGYEEELRSEYENREYDNVSSATTSEE